MSTNTKSGLDSLPALDRRSFLELLAAGSLGLYAGRLSAEETPAKKPNIILIVADDLGYADLGRQGGTEVPTPHIDSIAKGGVRFNSGYVSCPVCSPTRAGLLTGRYQQRFGHEFNPGPDQVNQDTGEPIGLALDEITLANLMKNAGYTTGMVGKWHLGQDEQFHPMKRGFDEYYGFLGGAHPYLDPSNPKNQPIYRGFEKIEEKEYLTDAFGREAVAFVERHKKEPFFLYLTFNAVHSPLEAPEKHLAKVAHIEDKQHQTYLAMLSAMDDAVGLLFNKLTAEKLDKDTLVFFISDNGGPEPNNTSDNGPLRATKGTVYEGGIRVPFFARWEGHIPANSEFMQPVIALDILPTVLAAVGGVLPTDRPIDGVNLLPFVTGEKKDTPHEALFWRFGQRKAVRKGDWKLVQIGEQKPELYNLANDIGETQNLAESNLEKLAGLQSALADWEKGLISPKWSPKQRPTWQDEAEKNQANPQAKQKKPVRGRDDQDQSQREERRRNRRNREKNANLNENTAKD